MSMGYMGYVKLGSDITLATSADVKEVVAPIYSSGVRGAGWYNPGTAHWADDVVRYEGNIDVDLRSGVFSFLTDWVVEARTTPKTLVISPDSIRVFTYTSAYNSSANFASSEGSLITGSFGVLALTRVESGAGTYITNKNGQAFSVGNPYAYWESVVSVSGITFGANTYALDWNFDVSNNPVVVYACTGTRGPLAVLMGEIEATCSISMFCLTGVAGPVVPLDPDATSVSVSFGGTTLSLPRAELEGDGSPLSGGDSVISRVFDFKGLAKSDPPFKIT